MACAPSIKLKKLFFLHNFIIFLNDDMTHGMENIISKVQSLCLLIANFLSIFSTIHYIPLGISCS